MTKLTLKHRLFLGLALCLAYAAALMVGMVLFGDTTKGSP
jgi:hypothetical protein